MRCSILITAIHSGGPGGPAAGGEWVHVARDVSGALVSYTVGVDGEPRAVALVAPPSTRSGPGALAASLEVGAVPP